MIKIFKSFILAVKILYIKFLSLKNAPSPIVLETDLKTRVLLLIFIGILKLVRIIKVVCIKIVCIVEMWVLPDTMPLT